MPELVSKEAEEFSVRMGHKDLSLESLERVERAFRELIDEAEGVDGVNLKDQRKLSDFLERDAEWDDVTDAYRGIDNYGPIPDRWPNTVIQTLASTVDDGVRSLFKRLKKGNRYGAFMLSGEIEPSQKELAKRMAEEATEMVHHYWQADKRWERTLIEWIKDSLLYPIGVIKTSYLQERTTSTVRNGLTRLQMERYVNSLNAVVVREIKIYKGSDEVIYDALDEGDNGPFKVKVERVTSPEMVKNYVVPVHSFVFDSYARDLEDSRVVGDIKFMTRNEIEKRYPDIPESVLDNRAYWERTDFEDKGLWKTSVTECYARIPYENEDRETLVMGVLMGPSYEKLIFSQEVEVIPYATIVLEPRAGKIVGEPLGKRLLATQAFLSAVARGMEADITKSLAPNLIFRGKAFEEDRRIVDAPPYVAIQTSDSEGSVSDSAFWLQKQVQSQHVTSVWDLFKNLGPEVAGLKMDFDVPVQNATAEAVALRAAQIDLPMDIRASLIYSMGIATLAENMLSIRIDSSDKEMMIPGLDEPINPTTWTRMTFQTPSGWGRGNSVVESAGHRDAGPKITQYMALASNPNADRMFVEAYRSSCLIWAEGVGIHNGTEIFPYLGDEFYQARAERAQAQNQPDPVAEANLKLIQATTENTAVDTELDSRRQNLKEAEQGFKEQQHEDKMTLELEKLARKK